LFSGKRLGFAISAMKKFPSCNRSNIVLHLNCQLSVTTDFIERLETDMMNTFARPVRDLRNNYNEIIALANAGNQVIITQNGREAAVVIGAQAYKDFEVFLYRQHINRELEKAKEKAKDPSTQWLSEDAFWAGFEDSL